MNRPFEVTGIDHIVLRVTDLQAALAFYRDLLGCSLERELPELGLYQLRAGHQLIDLVPVGSELGGSTAPQQARRNQDHFCLQITPFDETALVAYLKGRTGLSDIEERYGADGYGPSVYIDDPDGNTVELKAKPV